VAFDGGRAAAREMIVETETSAEPLNRTPRGTLFSILAFVFGAGALGGLFGIGLVIGWFDTDEGGIHRVHDLGFGILYGVLVAAALFAMVWRPWAKPSVLFQVVAVAVAVIVAALISSDPGYIVLAAALLVTCAILLALHPARESVLHPKAEPSPVMAGFVLLGAIPLVWFALSSATLQRNGSTVDPHVRDSHWTTMTAMAIGLLAVGLLSSARISGWRLTAWCAGLGTGVYGLASIVFRRIPGTEVPYAGSEGISWGLLALVGGISFIVVAEWDARRSRVQT
jgi:hypothetical protein